MKRIVIALCLLAGLGSCQIYRTYQRPELPEVDSLFRQPVQGADTTSLADLTWRELFTDSRLQRLIDSGIMNNSDLQIARLRVAEARASLTASRLAYLPSLSLTPQGAVNAPEHAPATRTYDLAAAAEWKVDLFGKLLNEKRGAAAALAGQEAYRQAVETQLVATVANSYYTLLMLDRQLEITRSTSEVWAENVRVMEALKRAGQTTEMAVAQTVAEQVSVEASVLALERQVLQTENALCVLLGTTPRTIDRSTLDAQRFPDSLAAGIPLRLVDRRPDVRQSEAALAEAYYATNTARSAFYPSITLGGTAGWTNAAGGGHLQSGAMAVHGRRLARRTALCTGQKPRESENRPGAAAGGFGELPTESADGRCGGKRCAGPVADGPAAARTGQPAGRGPAVGIAQRRTPDAAQLAELPRGAYGTAGASSGRARCRVGLFR